MSSNTGPVVIVGAGQAGGWVALTVRQLQPGREVVIIGEEDHPPYERPPLSKDVLSGKATPESTYLRPLEFYAENRITLRLGTCATAIDRDHKCVWFSDGSSLSYGTLIVATGMRPRPLAIPGGDHPRVRALRTMGDIDAIRAQLTPGNKIVAIGAGFIGLEVAAVAVAAGCEVTVLETASSALGRVVAPEVAKAITARHERRGVTFRYGISVTAVSDAGPLVNVHLADAETVVADLVLCGIGGIPNDDLARVAGVECDNGIIVDETGRTSDPTIYSAGDVCRQWSAALGRRIRLESWQNAQNQAICVGKHVAGAAESYVDLPWFWTDQYEDNFQIIGAPEHWDRIVWRGAPEENQFTVIYMQGDRVVAGNTLNNARDIRPLRQMILEARPVDDALLLDVSIPLQKLQKMQAA
jgi:3-phenylpropionate/trans-cinnamate dioxygenase ferredoxin reductase subunit